MTIQFKFWLRNLRFYLMEALICNLMGHRPDEELDLFSDETLCLRCFAKVKKGEKQK